MSDPLEDFENRVLVKLQAHVNEMLSDWEEKRTKADEQYRLERDAEHERHAQQIEFFLGSIEKILEARL